MQRSLFLVGSFALFANFYSAQHAIADDCILDPAGTGAYGAGSSADPDLDGHSADVASPVACGQADSNADTTTISSQRTAVSASLSDLSQYFALMSEANPAWAEYAESLAIGGNASASAEYTIAIGYGSRSHAEGAMALGPNASARNYQSVAIGNGATTQTAFQFMFGTQANTYTMPGLVSGTSRDRQTGALELVTVDAEGNLAADGGATIAGLRSQIDQNGTSLAGAHTDIKALSTRFNQLELDIDGVHSEVRTNTSAIKSNMSQTAADSENLARAQSKLDTHDKMLTSHASKLDRMDGDIVAHAGRLAKTEAGMAAQGRRLTATELQTETNKTDIAETAQTVSVHTTQIANMSSVVNANQTRIANSETAIAENASAIRQVQTQFEQLDLTVGALSSHLVHAQKKIEGNGAGIAIANAMAGSSWLQSDERVAFTANWGHFDGHSAVAFSGSARLGQNISANAALGAIPNRGEVGARAGLRWGW